MNLFSKVGLRPSDIYIYLILVMAALSWFVPPGYAGSFLLVTVVALSAVVWLLALAVIAIDPLDLGKAYSVRHSAYCSIVGLAAGGIAAYAFFETQQRHLSAIPCIWFAAITGFGTGIVFLWGLIVEWRRRRLDNNVVALLVQSSEETRRQVTERIEALRLKDTLVGYSTVLDASAEHAGEVHIELDIIRRAQISSIMLVAAESCRAAAKLLEQGEYEVDHDFLATVRRVLLLAGGRQKITESELDQLRAETVSWGIRCMADAGGPKISLVTSNNKNDHSDELARVSFVRSTRNLLLRPVIKALGLVSVVGPRTGAFFGVSFLTIALLIMGLYELPANGLSYDNAVRVLGLPFVVLYMLWLWLSIKHRGAVYSLVAQILVVSVAVFLVCSWWIDVAPTWPGVRPPIWATTLVLMVGALPGWSVMAWVLRRRIPYPHVMSVVANPETISLHVEKLYSQGPVSLETWAARWRGEMIAGAWRDFFTNVWTAWLNKTVIPVLEKTAPEHLSGITGLVQKMRNQSLESGQNLVCAAIGASSLDAIARWQLAFQCLGQLMGDEEIEMCKGDLERLNELQIETVDDWFENYSKRSIDVEQTSSDVLAFGKIYPPA